MKKSESPTYPNSQPPNSVVENDEAETDISPTADPTTSNNVGMDVETGGGRGEEATSLVGVENGAIEMAGGDRVPSRKPSSLAAAAPKTITVKDRLM